MTFKIPLKTVFKESLKFGNTDYWKCSPGAAFALKVPK